MIQAAVVQHFQLLSVPVKYFLLLMRHIWPLLWQPCLTLLHLPGVRFQPVVQASTIGQSNAMLRYLTVKALARQKQTRLSIISGVVVSIPATMSLPIIDCLQQSLSIITAYQLSAVTQLAGA
jgi:hypothetical protein